MSEADHHAAMEAPAPDRMTPTPRQGLARTSLFLGLASYLLVLGPFTGIPAILTGHWALRRHRRDPRRFAAGGTAITGLVLGYVSLLVGLPLMALTASLVVPRLLEAHAKSQTARCSTNLKELATAARTYSAAHQERLPDHLTAITNLLASPAFARCPQDLGNDTDTDSPEHEANPHPNPSSYDLLLPGATLGEAANRPFLRCPIHGTTVSASGTLEPGKIGPARKRRKPEP